MRDKIKFSVIGFDKLFIIMMMLMIFFPLFSDNKKNNSVFIISPTTGAYSGLRIGMGLIDYNEDNIWELTINYSKELISHTDEKILKSHFYDTFFYDCLFFQASHFKDMRRVRSYLKIKFGISSVPPVPSGCSACDPVDWLIPVIALGYGYSFKINDIFFIRPSIDIGFQPKIVNVDLELTF